MRVFKSRGGLAIVVAILLLALFLIRPGAQRLHARIVDSISLAMGRQVEVGSVHLRFFPQPGFDLENFVVHDDPSFSAEPMLRAQEVTAALRVTSLFRGRLEIARLDLTEPSINLVRNEAGHWNLENLLERSARTAVAPTGKAKSETRPAFPYIEADTGRINFKFGQEKKAYALGEADFALWQDSENAWGMRLSAKPLRTDLNLTDTGAVKVSGTWQRAQSLRETPVQFNLQWDRAQLGQLTKLAYGTDKGWRGTTRLSATLAGTPADLAVIASASIQDFRRYDILEGGDLRLSAQCVGHYSSVDHILSKLSCRAPVGDGAITLEGNISHPTGARTYDLALAAKNLPLQSLADAAEHAKKDIPSDLTAIGKVDVVFKLQRTGPNDFSWRGGGETLGVHLVSATTKTDLTFDRIPFAISGGPAESGVRADSRSSKSTANVPADSGLSMGPFELPLGRPAPAVAQAWISKSGYTFTLQGDAQVRRLFQVARTFGVPAPQLAADGVAKIDLHLAGAWAGFAPVRATGKAQLHAVRAEVRGWNAPLQIASANVSMSQDEINVQDLTASIPGSVWHGSITLPRHCESTGHCPVHFDLHADEIASDDLHQLLNPRPGKRPWYGFLSSSPQAGTPYLARVYASGKITSNRVATKALAATHVSANIELKDGKLRMSDVRAEILGGKHVGEWTADFSGNLPTYTGSGSLQHIGLGQLSEAMQDNWITGTGNAIYRVSTSGFNTAELFGSADGTLQVQAHDGSLPHLALAGASAPLLIRRFDGELVLHNGKFQIQAGKLETPVGIYLVSGTASLGKALDVKLARDGAPGFNITGTLAAPRVTTAPETQAVLKP